MNYKPRRIAKLFGVTIGSMVMIGYLLYTMFPMPSEGWTFRVNQICTDLNAHMEGGAALPPGAIVRKLQDGRAIAYGENSHGRVFGGSAGVVFSNGSMLGYKGHICGQFELSHYIPTNCTLGKQMQKVLLRNAPLVIDEPTTESSKEFTFDNLYKRISVEELKAALKAGGFYEINIE